MSNLTENSCSQPPCDENNLAHVCFPLDDEPGEIEQIVSYFSDDKCLDKNNGINAVVTALEVLVIGAKRRLEQVEQTEDDWVQDALKLKLVLAMVKTMHTLTHMSEHIIDELLV